MTLSPESQTCAAHCNSEHQVVIDLSDLTFAASADLSVLIKTLQRVQKCGVQIALGGPQENVRRIFEIKQLDRIFPILRRDREQKSIVAMALSA